MSYGSSDYSAMPSGDASYSSPGSNMLSYGFLEGGYQYRNPDNDALDGSHGLAVTLSVQLFKPLFLKAEFGWSKGGSGSTAKEYDFTYASLGAGLYLPIISRLHIVAEAGGLYGKMDATKDSISFTEGAFYVRPALRFAPIDILELQTGVTLTSSDDFGSTIIDVSAYLRLIKQLDVGLGVDFGDEYTGFTGGLRFRW